ncbi:hypothetical protein ACFE04_029306 [Oxalis oulophora]
MHTSQDHQTSSAVHGSYHKHKKQIDPYCSSRFQVLNNNNPSPDSGSEGTAVSFQAGTNKEQQYFTLESSTPIQGFVTYDSPSINNISSQQSPVSSQSSQSCILSPVSSADNGNEFRLKLRQLEMTLLGHESNVLDNANQCCFKNGTTRWTANEIRKMIPHLDLKQVLVYCATTIDQNDISHAVDYMHLLEHMVSISGDPLQRLGAYMLEGLRARLELSGSMIYKSLKCEQPTSSELMSYMHILYNICPYWKLAYTSANAIIREVTVNEPKIHIIDFQIAQGTQWAFFIHALGNRQGGGPAPHVRITGVDDSQSLHARGGGLGIIGERLKNVAETCNVPFEFHDTFMTSGCEVELESLEIRPDEAIVANFPYVLHHMPDESVSTLNHRDRLLRLVKSLSPKVVTLVEQESNTNTSPFFPRFLETLDYYTAMFESIDVDCRRDDKKRISAEQHCVARDIVNMVACEGAERVERHELFGKWRSRLTMGGFSQIPLSPAVSNAIVEMLKEYNKNYRIEERHDGAIYLYWLNRAMATTSAWR